MRECHSVLGAFVKGQFLVMFLLGIVYAVGLQLIGLEVGLIIGMVAGLASIIPYLGFAWKLSQLLLPHYFNLVLTGGNCALVGCGFMVVKR